MVKLLRTLLAVGLGFWFTAAEAQNWNTKDDIGIKTWNGLIPQKYNPNLETVRHHFLLYNARWPVGRFDSEPSPNPMPLNFNLRDEPYVDKQLEKSYLVSYLMYEKGTVVIDKVSPDDRLGDLIDDDTLLYSMSLGKSVGSYLMGHAICKGYIESLDHKLSDWPIIHNTLIAQSSVQDVINAAMGHQRLMKNNEILKKNNTNVNNRNIAMLASLDLSGSEPSRKKYEYGQLPANIALNYIDFKTGHKFEAFMDEVFRDYVGLESTIRFHQLPGYRQTKGIIRANFFATRYDTLRIAIAILEDWKNDTCVGKYLKEIHARRIKKGDGSDKGPGHSRSYGGFFHMDYPGSSKTVFGMEGYGGIGLLINFDDERIVYGHSVHRDFDFKRLYTKVIDDGRY